MPVNNDWLPIGEHWGLRIQREQPQRRPDTGPMDRGATDKLVWHTTEGRSFGGANVALRSAGAQPHVLIAPSGSVLQYLPFSHYAKSLEHPPRTPATNTAGCIQVEMVGFAHDSEHWPLEYYMKLAALAVLIEHRTGIARHSHSKFVEGKAQRIPAAAFHGTDGHLGHQHVPNQPSGHWDPGHFQIHTLFDCMKAQAEHYG